MLDFIGGYTQIAGLLLLNEGEQQYSKPEVLVQVAATDPDDTDTLSYAASFESKSGAGAVNMPTGFSIGAHGLFRLLKHEGLLFTLMLGLHSTSTGLHGLRRSNSLANFSTSGQVVDLNESF